MKQLKRVCGASVGAITAALVAVGLDWEELLHYMNGDMKKLLQGTTFDKNIKTDNRDLKLCSHNCSSLMNLLQICAYKTANE